MGLLNLFRRKNSASSANAVDGAVKKISGEIFPRGEQQIIEETDQLYTLLGGKLNKRDVRLILTKSKTLLFISDDKSKDRIVPSIINYSKNAITIQEAGVVYHTLLGYSRKTAILIDASSLATGLEDQVNWLTENFGEKDTEWKAEQMIQDRAKDGRVFQILDIALADGSKKTIIFDVTSYAGKS